MSRNGSLRLAFLGAPKAVRELDATPIADRKLALLLFALAVRGRNERARLAGWLWPDVEPERRLASLRLRVHKARQLDPRLLLVEGAELELSPEVGHDLQFLRQRRQMPLDTALALADTPLLRGIDLSGLQQFEILVQGIRELMASHAIHAIHQEVKACRSTGRIAEGIRLLQRILVLAPLNEAACRHLMGFYMLNHDRASALRVFERLRSGMRRLLGAEPSSRTRQLHASILLDEQVSWQDERTTVI